jgi:hypothetical protein
LPQTRQTAEAQAARIVAEVNHRPSLCYSC